MKLSSVSALRLEQYRLGELSPEDRRALDKVLAEDSALRSGLENLDKSDDELRRLFPLEHLRLEEGFQKPKTFRHDKRLLMYGGIAAGVLICVLLPVLYFTRSNPGTLGDRAKGSGGELQSIRTSAAGAASSGTELSLFLLGNQESPLPDKAVLREGNTVQLAYTIPAGEYYGVIFSIDGRSELTMHYPYRRGQTSQLVSGRRTFLNEAYILDDAPDFEIFVMVVSRQPLDTEAVLLEARRNAENVERLEEDIKSALSGCEVAFFRILKN